VQLLQFVYLIITTSDSVTIKAKSSNVAQAVQIQPVFTITFYLIVAQQRKNTRFDSVEAKLVTKYGLLLMRDVQGG
jgi:hypothetical protein